MTRKGEVKLAQHAYNVCECRATAWQSLTNGWGIAIVDIDDAHLLRDYKWSMKTKRGDRVPYANSNTFARRNKGRSMLHQAILEVATSVDHRNHNGLDCRRDNLREAGKTGNIRNTRKRRAQCTSRFKGVDLERCGRWRARIFVEGRRIQLGVFDSEVVAALCYNRAATTHYGEFAYLNKIDQ